MEIPWTVELGLIYYTEELTTIILLEAMALTFFTEKTTMTFSMETTVKTYVSEKPFENQKTTMHTIGLQLVATNFHGAESHFLCMEMHAVFGGEGSDTLNGGANDDHLYGGIGNDQLLVRKSTHDISVCLPSISLIQMPHHIGWGWQ